MTENDNEPRKSELDKYKEQLKVYLDKIKHDPHVENAYNYAKTNTRDTIAYTLLLIGLLLLFFNPSYGQTLIGVIFGLYFSQEIFYYFKDYEYFVQFHGWVKSLVFLVFLTALLLSAPFIFIGILVALALRQLLT